MNFSHKELLDLRNHPSGIVQMIAGDCLELMKKHAEFHRRARAGDELARECRDALAKMYQAGWEPENYQSKLYSELCRMEEKAIVAMKAAQNEMFSRQENAYNNAIEHAASKARDLCVAEEIVEAIRDLRHDNFWAKSHKRSSETKL